MSYGCHNREPLRAERPVQNGWTPLGKRQMAIIPDPMTKDCQYTHTELGQVDPRCAGCRWKFTGAEVQTLHPCTS
jgi:hypothetical protein